MLEAVQELHCKSRTSIKSLQSKRKGYAAIRKFLYCWIDWKLIIEHTPSKTEYFLLVTASLKKNSRHKWCLKNDYNTSTNSFATKSDA